jgi:hypothetical protein
MSDRAFDVTSAATESAPVPELAQAAAAETAGTAEQLPARAAAESERETAVRTMLAQWVNDCIHNSPASRDAAVLEHLTNSALPELARRILKEV